MKKIELKDVLKYIQPTKYIVSNEFYSDDYTTPVLTAGQTFILGYTNENDNIFEANNENPIILFDDFTTAIKWVDFPFKVKSSACKILQSIGNLPIRYVYYAMKNIKFDNSQHKRYWISEYSKIKIIDHENKNYEIVKKLDRINNLIGIKKNQLNLLDELIKSRFVEMFESYDKIALCEVADIIMGQSPDSKTYNDDGNGMPFFQGKADYGDKVANVAHWTTKPSKVVEANTVLMSVRAPVGPVNYTPVKCCIGRGLCGINAKQNLTNNEFLYNALIALQDEISGKGVGSTFAAITKKDVYDIKVPNAPIELMNAYSEFAKLIDKSKLIVQEQIKNLQELLDKKMDEYFNTESEV